MRLVSGSIICGVWPRTQSCSNKEVLKYRREMGKLSVEKRARLCLVIGYGVVRMISQRTTQFNTFVGSIGEEHEQFTNGNPCNPHQLAGVVAIRFDGADNQAFVI